MACSLSLTGRQYPCAKAVGGLKKIFFSAFVDGGLSVSGGVISGGTWYGYDLRGASSVENGNALSFEGIKVQLASGMPTDFSPIAAGGEIAPKVKIEPIN